MFRSQILEDFEFLIIEVPLRIFPSQIYNVLNKLFSYALFSGDEEGRNTLRCF